MAIKFDVSFYFYSRYHSIVLVLLYGCTTWTLTKCFEKKLDENYRRMLHAVLNRSWKQYPTKQQLYDHLPPISQTIEVRWTRHVGHNWRSKEKLISDILLLTPAHRYSSIGQPAKTYIYQLCVHIGCYLENLTSAIAMDDESTSKGFVLSAQLDI